MAGSSIFVTYGLKSGGGAPFLRRTRNAFGQLQSRTRTGATSTQRQRRTRNCSCSTTSRLYVQSGQYVTATSSQGSRPVCNTFVSSCSGHPFGNECFSGGDRYESTCFSTNTTTCSLSSFTGGTADAGCTTLNHSCGSNRTPAVRECRNATICNFGSFTSFSNDNLCVAANPACSNGAINRECQTVFSFREQDGSSFEEADECVTSTQTAAEGAVQVECIAN